MFIKNLRKQYPISLVCELLQVSQSGYHKWIKKKVSQRAIENQRILEIIWFHHNKSKGIYGLPRIYAAMRKEGVIVNKKRVARLMRENNIKAKTKRRFRITTVQNSKAAASENILKQNFTASSENKICTGDITCLWIKESWLYLAVVMDIYSRKIVLAGR